jgi:hypothetical protein
MKWFTFMDMFSGGDEKLRWHFIHIQAKDRDAAVDVFVSRFDRYPFNETCACCGADYMCLERDTLVDAIADYDNMWRRGECAIAILA